MPATDFPFGYNGKSDLPCAEVLAMQKLQNGITNAALDILKIPLFKRKEEPDAR